MSCDSTESAQPGSPKAAAPHGKPQAPATPPLVLQLSATQHCDGPPTPLELSPPPSPRDPGSTDAEGSGACVHDSVPPRVAFARPAGAGLPCWARVWSACRLLCAMPFTLKLSRAARQRCYHEARQEAASGSGAPSAADQLLTQMNRGNVGGEPVDLHGLHRAEAVGVVRDVVRSCTQERPRWRRSVHIVAFGVGCGLHSPSGQSQLGPAVEAALHECNIHCLPSPQDGCVFAIFYPPQQA